MFCTDRNKQTCEWQSLPESSKCDRWRAARHAQHARFPKKRMANFSLKKFFFLVALIGTLSPSFSDESTTNSVNHVPDPVEDALKEFDGDYDIEELRLMRIKFISEVAN